MGFSKACRAAASQASARSRSQPPYSQLARNFSSRSARESGSCCQPHLRGGQHEPLSRADIERKFRANCDFGGWERGRTDAWLEAARHAFDKPMDLAPFRG